MERRDSHVVWTPCFRRPAAIWPSGRTSLPVSARETAEIVMCVPSLVPSLATQIKSSSLLFSSSIKWGIRRQQVVVSSHRTEEEAQKA